MLKVFLVEDEAIVRESIKKNICWEEHGYIFSGEASDGEMAYSMICEKKPDVVITDIKMPFMDGLELGQLLRKEMPNIKIIFLTGYGEFDYAKKAIQIGAMEYLLKPVTSSSLIEVIDRVAKVVEEENTHRSFIEQYEQDMQEREKLESKSLFEDLILGRRAVSEILGEARKLRISLSGSFYSIILFSFYMGEFNDDIYSEEVILAQNILEADLKNNDQIVMFKRGIEGYSLLVKGEDENSLRALLDALTQKISSVTEKHHIDISFFVGVGSIVNRLSDVHKSFRQANRAFAYRHFIGKNKAVFSERLGKTANIHGDNNLSLDALDISKFDRKLTEQFLRSGLAEESVYLIDEIFNGANKNQLESIILRQYIIMDIYFACAGYLEDIGASKSELIDRCGDIGKISEHLDSVNGSRAFLKRLLMETCKIRDECSTKKRSNIIAQSKDYILQNYHLEDISLNMVAKNVNMSPTHFSAIFSKETGETFVEYLTSIRMDKAKEMLRFSDKKTAEIAWDVGYPNSHYFSFLFKKLNGISPRDFRAGKDSLAYE